MEAFGRNSCLFLSVHRKDKPTSTGTPFAVLVAMRRVLSATLPEVTILVNGIKSTNRRVHRNKLIPPEGIGDDQRMSSWLTL